MNEEYKMSGSPGLIMLVSPLIGLPLVFILSLVYAYIDVYNPLVYFTAIVWVGYLFCIVIALSVSVKISKCRSPLMSMLMGTLLGTCALYLSWVCYCHVTLERYEVPSPGIAAILFDPRLILEMILAVSEASPFSLKSVEIPSMFNWVIWLIEAGGIVLAGFIGGQTATHEEVFCESCGRWAQDVDEPLWLSFNNDPDAIQAIVSGDVDRLLTLPLAEAEETPMLRVNLKTCPTCDKTSTADVDLITSKVNDEGKTEQEAADLSPVFILRPAQLARFRERL